LLVVRELLLGPQRFSDLRHALPNASSNLVADRLRELEDRAVLHRRKLAPPAGSWVYELTEWGRELEPIVLALGDWGLRVPLPPTPTLSATSVLLALLTFAHPDPKAPSTMCRLELDDRVWTVRMAAGRVHVRQGEPSRVDVSLSCDPKTLSALLDDPEALDAAVTDGRVIVAGDLSGLRRLFQGVTFPMAAPLG
jgi:DNA-binding HxlR family transcriptional regulator